MNEEKQKDILARKARKIGVPAHIIPGLIDYIVDRKGVGDFLTAVLSNNLKEACARADEVNKHKLFEIVYFLYNHAPHNCWGSEEEVEEWLG